MVYSVNHIHPELKILLNKKIGLIPKYGKSVCELIFDSLRYQTMAKNFAEEPEWPS